MIQRLAMAAAIALLASGPAAAQFGNSGFLAPDTKFEKPGIPASHQTNNADIVFAQLLGEGGLAEVQLGQLAREKSHSKSVEDFAERMVRDHTTANEELQELAKAAGILLPSDVNAEHKAVRERLDKMEAAAFDSVYIAGQVVDHIKAAQLLAWEIDAGQNASLQRFAAATLPTVLSHLKMAQDLLVETRLLAAR
jgi:putative membrane protein